MPSPTPIHPPTPRSTVLAAILAALVLLPLLGHRPLTDWDEGIYAEIAREMLAGHSLRAWLLPHWNGALWFEKPPLQMWLTAISLRLFGLDAFAARLPSALAGIAVVATLHHWLLRRQNQLTAWLTTLILLSAFGFQHAARVGETDTLLSLFSLLAVLAVAELLLNNARAWLLFFSAFALALMTKGAASLTLPLTAFALTTLHPRHLLRHPKTFTAGLALFLAITLPWHIYVYTHFGQLFLRDYIGFHTLTRATAAIEGHHTHPWFYLWVLLLSAPPFALLYPLALATPFRNNLTRSTQKLVISTEADEVRAVERSAVRPANPTRPTQKLVISTEAGAARVMERPAFPADPLQALAIFALLVLILFTAASTRLPHYIAPAYPALSALTAALLANWFHSRQPRPKLLGLAAATVLLYTAAALLTAKPRKTLHNPQLRDGYNTPDNRESVAVLQQLTHTQPTLIPSGAHSPEPKDLPGPLLVWRQTPVVPLTTDAFYAHRLAQQVTLAPPPTDLPPDPYFNQPQSLTLFLNTPHLLLLDRTLLPQLPPNLTILPLATGPTQELVILQPNKASQ